MKTVPLCEYRTNGVSFDGDLLFEYCFVCPEDEQERAFYWQAYGDAYQKEISSPRFTVLEYRITECHHDGTRIIRPPLYPGPTRDNWDLRSMGATPYKSMLCDSNIEHGTSLSPWHAQYIVLLHLERLTSDQLNQAQKRLAALKDEVQSAYEAELREKKLYRKAEKGTVPAEIIGPIQERWKTYYHAETVQRQTEVHTLTAKYNETQAALETLPL